VPEVLRIELRDQGVQFVADLPDAPFERRKLR